MKRKKEISLEPSKTTLNALAKVLEFNHLFYLPRDKVITKMCAACHHKVTATVARFIEGNGELLCEECANSGPSYVGGPI